MFGAALCAALLGYALYVEHGMFMMPCPLCILQRIAFLGMGVFFLVGAATGPRPRWLRRVVSSLVGLWALAGAGVTYLTARLPSRTGLLVGALVGMIAGFVAERIRRE